ncbi:Protein F14F9.5, partial [Aphelenchoides avenae]
MTFNIWISGANVRDGLYKIAKHIRILDPDIVALQETESGAVATNLTRLLGPKWTSHVHGYHTFPDTAILTKHKVTNWTQIMAGEKNKAENGRYANMKELVENAQFNKFLQMTSERPLIVAGDFNSPSHLDWIEET